MKAIYAAAFTMVLYVLTGCSGLSNGPTKVTIDKKAFDSTITRISIDGTINMKFSGDSTHTIELKPGTHFVQVNDSAKQEFIVPSEGGILNLDHQEYVVYEIKYKTTNRNGMDFDMADFSRRSPILVDSFLIIPKSKFPTPDSVLLRLLPGLQENNRSVEGMASNLAKTSTNLFIPKTWDYGMTDSIPETIEIRTSKYSINNSATRRAVMRARLFLFAVMLTDQEDYTVRSISEIKKGEADKRKEKELEKKQMDF